VSNSTLSGNNALEGGGIINQGTDTTQATATVSGSTIAENTADFGEGIYNRSNGTVVLKNTIVANIVSPSADCSGPIVDGGYDLSSDDTCGFSGTNHSLSNTNPLLGPLQDNGGSTQTHALLAGSPAIDRGNSALTNLPYDQRGEGFARVVDGNVDIGAFEVQQAPGSPPPPTGTPEDKQACKKAAMRNLASRTRACA